MSRELRNSHQRSESYSTPAQLSLRLFVLKTLLSLQLTENHWGSLRSTTRHRCGMNKDGPSLQRRMAQPSEAAPVVAMLFGFRVPIVHFCRLRSVDEITRPASCDCVAQTQESGLTHLVFSVFSVFPWCSYLLKLPENHWGSLRSTTRHRCGMNKDGPSLQRQMAQSSEAGPVVAMFSGFRVPIVHFCRWRSVVEIT